MLQVNAGACWCSIAVCSIYSESSSALLCRSFQMLRVNVALQCAAFSPNHPLLCTADPTWGDIFECCFKAQSSKARTSLLPHFNEKRRSSSWALSFERTFENVTPRGMGCTSFQMLQVNAGVCWCSIAVCSFHSESPSTHAPTAPWTHTNMSKQISTHGKRPTEQCETYPESSSTRAPPEPPTYTPSG